MTLQEALKSSEYDTATIVNMHNFRITVAQESKRIRVSSGIDGGFAKLSNIRTMDEFVEEYKLEAASDEWEAVGEADA